MKTSKKELPIPPVALSDKNAQELARIWTAHGQQHVTLLLIISDDPFIWEIFLVDLANHTANIYEQADGRKRSGVLLRIKEGFEAEWENPTDRARGGIMEKH